MSNPFSTHTSNLFADRGSIDQALAYASDVINGLSSTDKAAAWTALMVLVNTAAKVWPETPAQVPDDVAQVRAALAARADDAQASELSLVRADLDARMVELADRLAVLEEWMVPVIPPVEVALDKRITDLDVRLSVFEGALVTPEDMAKAVEAWAEDNIDRRIENWAEDNIDRRIENWCDTYLDDRMESWASDNLDIEDDVREEVRNVLRDVTVNLDL